MFTTSTVISSVIRTKRTWVIHWKHSSELRTDRKSWQEFCYQGRSQEAKRTRSLQRSTFRGTFRWYHHVLKPICVLSPNRKSRYTETNLCQTHRHSTHRQKALSFPFRKGRKMTWTSYWNVTQLNSGSNWAVTFNFRTFLLSLFA